jgi:hypothetical protein
MPSRSRNAHGPTSPSAAFTDANANDFERRIHAVPQTEQQRRVEARLEGLADEGQQEARH